MPVSSGKYHQTYEQDRRQYDCKQYNENFLQSRTPWENDALLWSKK